MLMSKDAIGEVSQMIDITDFYLPTRELLHFPVENATINWYIFN